MVLTTTSGGKLSLCKLGHKEDTDFYIHVTVHRNRFPFNNQADALIIQIYSVKKISTCFGHLLCPSSGVFYCTFGTGNLHARFL